MCLLLLLSDIFFQVCDISNMKYKSANVIGGCLPLVRVVMPV